MPVQAPAGPIWAPEPLRTMSRTGVLDAQAQEGYLPCPLHWPEAALAAPLREVWVPTSRGASESTPFGIAWAVLLLDAAPIVDTAVVEAIQSMLDDPEVFKTGVVAIQSGLVPRFLRGFRRVT